MLDNFLEKKVKQKLGLLFLLHSKSTVSTQDTINKLTISKCNLSSLVNEINIDFDGLATINISGAEIELSKLKTVDFFRLSHAIYIHSDVIKCLKFFILNDDEKPFSDFIDDNFLTKSVAYRIRKNCINYLHCIGLDVKNNKIFGNEYRIRFLIALLHYKYGLEIYNIYDGSLDLVRKLILSSNQSIDLNYLEQTINEYGYSELLIILSWKRIKYDVKIPFHEDFQKLKSMFMYDELINSVKNIIESNLDLKFSKDDYDYLFLVYCCTNNCIFADKWTYKSISEVHDIVFKNKAFSDLLYRISDKFGIDAENSHPIKATLIYFFKKCLFELQCIIPDKNFFIYSNQSPITNTITEKLVDLLNSWRKDNFIEFEIDKSHVIYLSIQLKFIMRQFMKPVEVFLLSDLNAELEVIYLYLSRTFSKDRIKITPLLLNAQNKDFLHSKKNCIIIIHKKFEPIIDSLNLDKSNIIVPITVEMNPFEISSIQNAISKSEKIAFSNFINK